MIRICFVCLGNICRSPTAEAIFQKLVYDEGLSETFEIDSSGTSNNHVGQRADARTRKAAEARGIHILSRGRQATSRDFERFDYLIVMDGSNRDNLLELAPSRELARKVSLFRDYDPAGDKGLEVPDPYYGGPNGFNQVFDICEAASRGLLEFLKREHAL